MASEIILPKGTPLSLESAQSIISSYLQENSAAVALYDRTNIGPHDEVLPVDLLSLAALNAFGGRGSITVMAEAWAVRDQIEKRIKPITTRDFWNLPSQLLKDETARACDALNWFWEAGVRHWGGGTRPAKLLHRFRPNIIPIWDEFIGGWYKGPKQSWQEFIESVHADVMKPNTVASLKGINSELGCELPLLRLWDILLWKAQSVKV